MSSRMQGTIATPTPGFVPVFQCKRCGMLGFNCGCQLKHVRMHAYFFLAQWNTDRASPGRAT